MTARGVRLLLGAAALAVAAGVPGQAVPTPSSIPIPGGEGGIGFDDLRFSPSLGRVIVPAGRAGAIVLIQPLEWRMTEIGGFSASKDYGGGHDEGVTSADEGRGFLFATDRTAGRLVVVDPSNGRVATWTKLAGSPDYVRFVEPAGEVWVTQPDKERIEVFRLEGNPPKPFHDAFLEVPGGPESLVIDSAHGRAYTHQWKGETVALSTRNRSILAKWKNGCEGSRGISLDAERGFLFVGCSEGKGVTLDAKTGKVLGTVRSGNGIDIIDYSPSLSHLYLPGAKSATMGIVAVSPAGELSLLAEVPTAAGGHCVAADGSGYAYVCDPRAGRILVIPDHFGAVSP